MNMKIFTAVVFICVLASCASSPNPASRQIEVNTKVAPVSAGSFDAEMEKFLSSAVEKKTMNVLYYPEDNVTALEFKLQYINYRQFWNASARALLPAALAKYEADYAARSLVRKASTRYAYGYFYGLAHWNSVSFSTVNKSRPRIEFGYLFKGDSPYFTITQRQAEVFSNTNDIIDPQSPQIILYFTRAQAAELAKLLDGEYLSALVRPVPQVDRQPAAEPPPTEAADYAEPEFQALD
jgi:hypothetical protein